MIREGCFFPYPQPIRPTISLALSGGGARGFAQIGVLKTLEKYGYPVDGIAGTSMGAIVGGLYAIGYDSAELESLAKQIQWDRLIRDRTPRKQLFLGQKEEKTDHLFQVRLHGLSIKIPSAYTSGQSFTSLIASLVTDSPYPVSNDFDRLMIPFRAVSTDILSGQKVVFRRGSLALALRASMAIPLLFTPVEMDSFLLVDGGMVQNLPVDEARSLDRDLVIAVDTSSKLRSKDGLSAPWEIADQATTIMQQDQLNSQYNSADIRIRPDLEGISNTAFHRIDDIIAAGQQAAEAAIPQLEAALQNLEIRENPIRIPVTSVSFSGCYHTDPQMLRQEVSLDTSSEIPLSRIQWAAHALLQKGIFRNLSVRLDTLNHSLLFLVQENPWVSDIAFHGNHLISDSLLTESIETRSSGILNVHAIERDIRKIRMLYRELGCSLARTDTITLDSAGKLTFFINEGIIGDIRLYGNHRTRDFVILRELSIQKGDILLASRLRQGIDNIYSTGYFQQVRFDIQRVKDDYRLHIYLKEQGYQLLRGGLRYDLERRTRGSIQLIGENLLGLGIQGSIGGLIGIRDRQLNAYLYSNRLLNTYLTYRLKLAAEKHAFDYYKSLHRSGAYSQTSYHASLSVGQHMRRLGTLSLRLQGEQTHIRATEGENVPVEHLSLISLSIRSEVDTRDRVPFPSSGNHHILEYEFSGRFLGSKLSYIRLYSELEKYYPLWPGINFHPRLQWGTSDLTTPFAKRFHMGGMTSFMGLPENALVGRRFVCTNLELRARLPLPQWIESYIHIRYDFGGLWNRYAKITSDDFIHGAGGFLSINTPLGPAYIGYGRMSDGISRLYFSSGAVF
jgi:NTE family protein